MEPELRKVDWEQVKRCLAQINKTSKEFLYRALMIGGAAVWFYRRRLQLNNDPDFKISSTPEEEARWLSRDIDFTGINISTKEAFLLLPTKLVAGDNDDPPHIEVEGVRFGFAQIGMTINPEEAFGYALPTKIKHENEIIEVLIADPLTLYFEKIYLRSKRGTPNDHLHAELLFEYVAYELVTGAEKVLRQTATISEAQSILSLWIRAVKAPEILQDKRISARLASLLSDKSGHPIAQYLADARNE